MTSYGDVRKITEDALGVFKYVRATHNAPQETRALKDRVFGLIEDVQNNASRLDPSKPDHQRLINIQQDLEHLEAHLEPSNSLRKRLAANWAWPRQRKGYEDALQRSAKINQQIQSKILVNTTQTMVDGAQEKRFVRRNDLTALLALEIEQFISSTAPEVSKKVLMKPAGLDMVQGTGWSTVDQGSRFGIFEHVKKQTHVRTAQVAHVFCNHQFNEVSGLENPMNIVMSFWKHIVDQIRSVEPRFDPRPHSLRLSGQEGEAAEETSKLSMEEQIFLQSVISPGITLILDGLDELPFDRQPPGGQMLGKDAGRRRKLQNPDSFTSNRKILNAYPNVGMEAPEYDLELYILERFSNACLTPTKEVRDLLPGLLERCQGFFILARLFMDKILRAEEPCHQAEIIETLPDKVEDAYNQALHHLQANYTDRPRPDGRRSKAVQAIFWVAYVKNPLSVDQLRQILAWVDQEPGETESSKWLGSIIDNLTSGLVVTREDGSLALVHKTLSEYLEKDAARKEWFPTILKHIPTVLLRFLRYLSNQKGPICSSLESLLDIYPLCSFALQNWGIGLQQILSPGDILWEDVRAFLRTPFRSWSKEVQEEARNSLRMVAKFWPGAKERLSHCDFPSGNVSALYWISAFQLTSLIDKFADCTSECLVQDPLPTTPLGLAAGLGYVDVVQKLLDSGAKVNLSAETNTMVNSALSDAFWEDKHQTAELLVDAGAHPTVRRGENGLSPIDVLYLMDGPKCRDFFANFIRGSAPTRAQELQFLLKAGYSVHLRRAIDEGLDVNHPCENGKTALDYAMEMDNQEIIDILRSQDARANLQWPARRTEVYPYKSNLPDLAITALSREARVWETGLRLSNFEEKILLEIPISCTDPVRCIVF
ncbi:hypothetical protein LLEC1_06541 [Akanthomyces lecanii]|uniref:NACHT domain-containing protein n=1 Tax=Cordyceps confragosa TaxID=2714763 RepID=A0A179I9H6_CORDF|nr:hypothetical protein LLEC1_06541 [Akanthomyces lecanii]